jgi:hypothetical protein
MAKTSHAETKCATYIIEAFNFLLKEAKGKYEWQYRKLV